MNHFQTVALESKIMRERGVSRVQATNLVATEYIQTTLLKGEFAYCEICDNHTPRLLVVDVAYLDSPEIGCQYCFEAYGEIN